MFDAAASCAEDVVGEHKFESGLAVGEGVSEPVVLGFAEGDAPHISGLVVALAEGCVYGDGGVLIGVYDDEEGVSPGPGEIVLEFADVFDFFGIAGVKGVWFGLGEEGVSGDLGDHGGAIGGSVEVDPGGLFVIAVDKKEGGGFGDETEVGDLACVAGADGVAVDFAEVINAEIVAHTDVEVWFFGGGGVEGALV